MVTRQRLDGVNVTDMVWMVLFVSTVLVSLVLFAPALLEAQTTKKDYLMGSCSTSSSYYQGAVAISQILNKNVPEMRVTLVETGATHDNLLKIRKGQLDFSTITCPDGVVMAYYGTHQWEGKPWPKYRIVHYFYRTQEYYVVRGDSGCKTLRDLEGKKFHLGMPGSATEYNARAIFKALGIKPDIMVGSLGDALEMIKNNRIIGFVKSSPPFGLDSAIADIRASTSIKVLSFTEGELKTALETIPGIIKISVPASGIVGASEQGSVTTWGKLGGTIVTSDMPEEIGYKIIKAIVEKWPELCIAFKEASEYNPIKSTIEWTAGFPKPVPLHAGVVRYFKEKGFDVPASIIPSEYKK